MKKIYLSAILGIMMLSAKVASAQNEDCLGTPRATYYNIFNTCVVFIDGFAPNAPVVLLDLNLAIVGSTTTDATGFGTITFACNKVPYRVTAIFAKCATIVPPQAPLPVKLSSFNAQLKTDGSVGLKWVSSLELSSFKYVVQKSNDGLNFSDIGNVPAAGNSNHDITYNFTDNNFISGASYFRLKQVDIDGHTEYSKIVYVNNRNGLSGIISAVTPNPFISDVQLIGISSSELNSRNVQLFNSFGQRVNYRINGSNSIEIDPSSARGIYILKVKAQTFKLVKN